MTLFFRFTISNFSDLKPCRLMPMALCLSSVQAAYQEAERLRRMDVE
jgi:hypothetical protein